MDTGANRTGLPPAGTDSDILVLDAHTFKDLEIFHSDSGATSLFEFCNLTRGEGGSRALRRRMERPWSNPEKIRATQQSIAFIIEHRDALTRLPSAHASKRVDSYTHEILPAVSGENLFEFLFGASSLWINHDRHYSSIVRGVQVTCAYIRALRRFVGQEQLASPAGELGLILAEMQELLDRPKMHRVPQQEVGSWPWRILRLDQIFRVFEARTIARLLQLVHETDALVAMADVTRDNDFVMPQIEEGPLHVSADDVIHPFLEEAVANPVELDQQRRLLFLTGPNMAGKTTYLRAFSAALYLAHLGMGVPAQSFRFVPADRLFSSITLSDDMIGGVSYFRAEALRIKAIAEAIAAGHRVVALMDEPFKGTNVKDALDASLAILERFAASEECLFMFSSHLIELRDELSGDAHIDCRYFEADEGEGRLRFDYKLHNGVSSQRLGMRVLHEEGVFELLDVRRKRE